MSEQARAHLKKAIALLEANIWLELEEVFFPRFFDGPLRSGSAALEMVFAEQLGAVCIFLSNPRLAKFGREPKMPNARSTRLASLQPAN